MSGYFIITGTSRGIGNKLAQLLLDHGNYVCGISRNQAENLRKDPHYSHMTYDLNQIQGLEAVLEECLGFAPEQTIDQICLINNAAMLAPLKPIQECPLEEITANIHISLVAPMILTSLFMKRTEEWDMTRKIINISSGSAIYPNAAMSIYSTAKAGLNMFTQCVGAEQKTSKHPIEIIAVEPGMIDTEMQQIARSLPEEEFAMAKYFKDAYISGQLQSAEEIANHLFRIIYSEFKPGQIVHYLETP